jgi:hypothetical protein
MPAAERPKGGAEWSRAAAEGARRPRTGREIARDPTTAMALAQ